MQIGDKVMLAPPEDVPDWENISPYLQEKYEKYVGKVLTIQGPSIGGSFSLFDGDNAVPFAVKAIILRPINEQTDQKLSDEFLTMLF